jgi:hypothetical protein
VTTASKRTWSDDPMLIFSAVVLMSAGIMRLFDAIWAFRYKGAVPDNLQSAIFGHSLKTYGWLWLVMAILLVLAGLGVLLRNQFARWFGIVVAALGAISAIWWMPYYPIWSLVYIGIGVAVIYALVTHGGRTAAATS